MFLLCIPQQEHLSKEQNRVFPRRNQKESHSWSRNNFELRGHTAPILSWRLAAHVRCSSGETCQITNKRSSKRPPRITRLWNRSVWLSELSWLFNILIIARMSKTKSESAQALTFYAKLKPDSVNLFFLISWRLCEIEIWRLGICRWCRCHLLWRGEVRFLLSIRDVKRNGKVEGGSWAVDPPPRLFKRTINTHLLHSHFSNFFFSSSFIIFNWSKRPPSGFPINPPSISNQATTR